MKLLNRIDFIISNDIDEKANQVFGYGVMIGTRYEFGYNKRLFSYNDFLVELTTTNKGVIKVKSAEVVDSDVLINYTQNINLNKMI